MTERQQETPEPVAWTATTPRRTHPVTPVVKALRVAPGLLIFFFIFGGEGVTQIVGRIRCARRCGAVDAPHGGCVMAFLDQADLLV